MAKSEFSAGGIVVKRQGRGAFRVLLIKDSYGRWTWPKGNINKGEASRDAALREVTEEVGLKDIRIAAKIGQNKYFYRLKGSLIFKTVFIYLIEARGNEKIKVQKEEIVSGKWFAPAAALKKLEYKGAPLLLKKAVDKFKNI